MKEDVDRNSSCERYCRHYNEERAIISLFSDIGKSWNVFIHVAHLEHFICQLIIPF